MEYLGFSIIFLGIIFSVISTTLIHNNTNSLKMISYTFGGICIGYGLYLVLNGGIL